MKKRLFALATLMLCVVMMLSSCSLFTAKLKFKKVTQKDAAPETKDILTSATKVDIDGDFRSEHDYPSNKLVVFSGYDSSSGSRTTTVYNLEKGQIVWSGKDTKDVKYTVSLKNATVDSEQISILFVYKKGTESTYKVTVFSENGTEIVALNNVNKTMFDENAWVASDILCVQDKIYRISADGNASEVGNWSGLKRAPSSLQKAGDYYVDVPSSSYPIIIYDSSLNVTATYNVPMYDSSSSVSHYSANPLSNGNVIVQYTVRQDDMAKKYDLLMNGTKYDFYTELIEAKTGKVKELNLDYLFMSSNSVVYGDALEDIGASKKIDNLIPAYPIKDKQVDRNNNSAKVLSVTNKGRVAGVLEAPTPDTFLANGVELIAQNRWKVSAFGGRSLLLNEKGNVIGEISDLDYVRDDFFVKDNRVYDWDLNLKIDLNAENAEDVMILNHGILFKNGDGENMLYTNGSVQTLIGKDNNGRSISYFSAGAYMVTVMSGSLKYEIYNDQGTLLTTITDPLNAPYVAKVTPDGVILIGVSVSDNSDQKLEYYRVG